METMNPAWVEKARRALLTGQPRLAELYMRRGLREHPASRRRLDFYDAAQAFTKAANTFDSIIRLLRGPVIQAPVFNLSHTLAASAYDRALATARIELQVAASIRDLRWSGIVA